MICATIIERNGKVISSVFQKEEIFGGRSSSNEIRIDPTVYTQVSRKHCRISRIDDDNYLFEDLGSTHGSYIDGRPIKGEYKLKRGDVITLGRDGPAVAITWPFPRVTGQEGTHLRLRVRHSASFPLAFSDGFIDRFDYYEKLASGGFGEVWRGIPIDGGRPLAIKLMHPELLDPDNLREDDRESLIRRFAREARVTHLLSESGAPAIVRVHSWGDDPFRDYLYIIMDLIEGQSLDKLIFRRPMMAPEVVATYMAQIARGLEAAHNFIWQDDNDKTLKGVVHRDIKPNNLIIEEDNRLAWIVDFGVAGIQEGGERLTATNITVGTYQFLPLESIEENLITPATDLWGFAVTMYLTLSRGRFPYVGRQRSELVQAIRHGEMIPITAYRNDLSQDWMDMLSKSLNPNPEQRVQSAGEWADFLEAVSPPTDQIQTM